MKPRINPYFTQPDTIVLENLLRDVEHDVRSNSIKSEKGLSPELIERYADKECGEYEHDKRSILNSRPTTTRPATSSVPRYSPHGTIKTYRPS